MIYIIEESVEQAPLIRYDDFWGYQAVTPRRKKRKEPLYDIITIKKKSRTQRLIDLLF